MKYLETQDAIALTEAEIEQRQRFSELAGQVIEVVKKFDGKVFNVKLEKALKEIDKDLRVDTRYSFNIIGNYYDTRVEKSNGHDMFLDNPYCYLAASLPLDKALNDEKRIQANVISEEIERRTTEIQKKNIKMKAQLADIHNIIAKQKEILAQVKAFNDEIDYTILENFDLAINR